MIKKLLLLLTATATLGGSVALAEETWTTESYGRVRSTVEFNHEKTATRDVSWYDMTTDAFLGIKTTKDVGDGWTSTGTIEADLLSADTVVLPQYMFVTLESSWVGLSVGRQESSGTTFGGKYMENIDESLSTGETVGTGDFVKLTAKEAGLTFVTGRHANIDDQGNPSTTNTAPKYDERVLAIYYEGELAEKYPLAFSLSTIDERPAPNQSQEVIDRGHGNERYTGYSAHFGVPVEEMMFSFNYDTMTEVYLDSPTAPDKSQTMLVFGFDWDLPYNLGYSLLYSSQAVDDGSDSLTETTIYDMTLLYPYKGINWFFAYSDTAVSDGDWDYNEKLTLYGLGMAYHFGK